MPTQASGLVQTSAYCAHLAQGINTENFKIDSELMSAAPDEAIVMHCLPAYRGLEITDDVFEAHADTIMSEAENRLHFQRTLLHTLIADGGIG